MSSPITDLDTSRRCSSMPISPIPIDDCPPISYTESEAGSRRRSGSLSRVRETFDRTTINIKKRCEKKLLKMAELHLDMPLPYAGPCGLVYHVPEIPGEHTRESMTNVLNQCTDWMRDNPTRGGSPFESPSTPQRLTLTAARVDLLDFGTEAVGLPTLQPSSFPSLVHKKSVRTVEFFHQQEVIVSTGTITECPRLSAPTISGVLIDLEEQIHQISKQQHEIPRTDSRNSLHPDLEGVNAALHLVSNPLPSLQPPPPRPQRCSQIQKTTITITTTQKTVCQGHKSAPCTQDGKKVNTSDTVPPDQPVQNVFIRRKPCATTTTSAPKPIAAPSSPAHYLGVGLRPALPALLTIQRVVPETATTSTEVLDRINATQLSPGPMHGLRTLSRKGNGRDLRALRHDNRFDGTAVQHQPIPEQEASSIRSPLHGNVAQKISRFEKPLPNVPESGSSLYDRRSTRSQKRRGIYRPLQTTDEHRPDQTKVLATKADFETKLTIATKAKPFGEFQPYRPPPSQTTRHSRSPLLPPVPQTGRGSMLREIKRELFPNAEIRPSSPIRTSLLQQGKVSEKIMETNTAQTHKDLSPRPSYLASTTSPSQLPYIPYSRGLVRQGTLNELGGRVVEIRKQFEDIETEQTMPSTPLKSQDQRRSRRHFGRRTETITNPSSSTPSSLFYTHSNEQIDSVSSTPPTTMTSPSPGPQYKPYRVPDSSRTISVQPKLPHKQTQYQPYRAAPSPPPTPRKLPATTPPPPPPPPPSPQPQPQPVSLYATLHPQHASRINANPPAFRAAMGQATRDRLQAAADEAEFTAIWSRAVQSGRDTELIRRLDYAYEWKRFTDVEWDGRERDRAPSSKKKIGTGKDIERR